MQSKNTTCCGRECCLFINDLLAAFPDAKISFSRYLDCLVIFREEAFVCAADIGSVSSQGFAKFRFWLTPNKSHATRNQCPDLNRFRHRVRLEAVLHLQPVLEHTQETISIRKFGSLLFC